MLVEIYYEIDEFVKKHKKFLYQVLRQEGQCTRLYPCHLSLSEIMTILVYYHYSHYKSFKHYYKEHVQKQLSADFPDLVSYNRFIELLPRGLYPMCLFLSSRTALAQKTGIYFIDSAPLEVCHPKRAHQHKVFRGWAKWGKTSKGWFYGLKYHLVVNQKGELMSFYISSGNIADNYPRVLFWLTNHLEGYLFGDKGYLMKEEKKAFVEHDHQLSCFTKNRKNAKKAAQFSKEQQRWSKKRGLIESVVDLHKNHLNIEHSRHRNPLNGFTHIFSALAAYTFYHNKPTAYVYEEKYLLPEHLNLAA